MKTHRLGALCQHLLHFTPIRRAYYDYAFDLTDMTEIMHSHLSIRLAKRHWRVAMQRNPDFIGPDFTETDQVENPLDQE